MCADRCTPPCVRAVFYLARVAGEENPHEFVFALQLAGHQREGWGSVRVVPLLSASMRRKEMRPCLTSRTLPGECGPSLLTFATYQHSNVFTITFFFKQMMCVFYVWRQNLKYKNSKKPIWGQLFARRLMGKKSWRFWRLLGNLAKITEPIFTTQKCLLQAAAVKMSPKSIGFISYIHLEKSPERRFGSKTNKQCCSG